MDDVGLLGKMGSPNNERGGGWKEGGLGIAIGDANATNSDIFSNQCKMVTSAR